MRRPVWARAGWLASAARHLGALSIRRGLAPETTSAELMLQQRLRSRPFDAAARNIRVS